MTRFKKLAAAVFLGACLSVFLALPAWATHTGDPATPADVREEVLAEATPYILALTGIVIAIFGVSLIVTLSRKVTKMGKGGVSRS